LTKAAFVTKIEALFGLNRRQRAAWGDFILWGDFKQICKLRQLVSVYCVPLKYRLEKPPS
jgi:hypothetical protein